MQDEQARLLDEASAVVKEQAFYMRRAIESEGLREALRHASNLICELRTSLLSPKNYYDLYMQVLLETFSLWYLVIMDSLRFFRKYEQIVVPVFHLHRFFRSYSIWLRFSGRLDAKIARWLICMSRFSTLQTFCRGYIFW